MLFFNFKINVKYLYKGKKRRRRKREKKTTKFIY